MQSFYFEIETNEGNVLSGPYNLDELLQDADQPAYYLENLESIYLPFRHPEYEQQPYRFKFTPETTLLNEQFHSVRVGDIPQLAALFERNGVPLEISPDGTLPPFIRMFPSVDEVFEDPLECHRLYTFPLFSLDLKTVNPDWDVWAHIIWPVAFQELNYSDPDLQTFWGWDPNYDFTCLLSSQGKYIIEQKLHFLGDDSAQEGNAEAMRKRYETMRYNFEMDRSLNNLSRAGERIYHPFRTIAYQFKAKVDWLQHNEPKYFSTDGSGIFYILSTDITGDPIHLYYQPEKRRIIQHFQYT